ncbi:hypothetical protein [Nocardia blacklockiae]|uniref:hypothetical protein n=1 Tax=Nocardia blacklockiae TaxID=480036 RepID=UPI001894D7A1|nr:hypothetical protein [Nocardia blacklockiae]MBF6171137.1 hypothetical protein [Nocardia blacklockiae]
MRMADGIDLHAIASLIALIPDPSGFASIASVVVGVLGDLNVIELARQAGALQETLWKIVETITSGGDLAAIAASFTPLVSNLLGLATTVLGSLTGSNAATSPDLLGQPVTGGGSNLAGLAANLSQTASTHGASGMSQLLNDGLTAADFFGSGAHQSYDSYPVDSSGRSALQWLEDWFGNRIRQTGAGV